ncbi:alpha/beta fold hydrolase [Myxococcaceae bacterium GXIMD 01537]
MIQATGTQLFTVPLPLEEGGLLGGAQVAYEVYGEPSDENSVVILHDLTHSHRVLGPREAEPFHPSGWGLELVGKGKVLDPATVPIISVNLLGSPYGSTSPVSMDPETREPLGAHLTDLSVLDMARATSALVHALGFKRVRTVLGVGLGGMVALRLAALFPDLAAGVVTIGAAHILPETLRERMGLTRQVLWMDPEYRGGRYRHDKPPRRTLLKQRLEYLRLVYGREHLGANWASMAAAEVFLKEEAESFSARFDANAWALLCAAYVAADLSEVLDQVRSRALLVAGDTDALAPPRLVRDAYHRLSANGVRARYHEITGTGDHGTLLSEPRQLHGPLRDFLRRCR